MTWYVSRNVSGAIVWAGKYEQSGYADEALNDANQELQAFLAPETPQSVTNAQLKRQLDVLGKLTAAQAAVSQAGGLTLELWYGAGTFNRTDPLLEQMAAAIGMSSADVDAAFVAASKL